MKKKLAVLSFVGLSLVAISCGGNGSSSSPAPAKETTTTTLRPSTTTTVPSILDAYVATVKTELPGASRSEIIDLGKQACATIRAFGSIELAIIGIASDPTWTNQMAEMAGFVMGAAIPVFCPEFNSELRNFT